MLGASMIYAAFEAGCAGAQTLKPGVVLLDIGLPQLNGIEAQNQVRQLVPNAKVLFLTQNNDAGVIRTALSNGAQGYVLKADAGSELLYAIEAIVRDEGFISSAIEWPGSTDDSRDNEFSYARDETRSLSS